MKHLMKIQISKALGITGIDFSKSSHKFTYIVVYLHAVNNTNIVLNFEDAKKDPITGLTKFEINLERTTCHYKLYII
jgi:hypothetical protein